MSSVALQAILSLLTPILGLTAALGIGVAYLRTYRTDIISTLKDNAEAYKDRSERIQKDRDEYVRKFEAAQKAMSEAQDAARRAASASLQERNDLLDRIAKLERELGKKDSVQ